MNRKLLVQIHMYLAAFFTPAVLFVAISGGLYLAGIKGSAQQEVIYTSRDISVNTQSDTLNKDIEALLNLAGVKAYSFEYPKVKGSTIYTRPTSSSHYMIKTGDRGVAVIRVQPSLQKAMIELHKGHGPFVFKVFQQAFAVGLIFIMISGLWLGLSTARLRRPVLWVAIAGAFAFAMLIM